MDLNSSSAWVRGLLALFAAEGVDAERLVRETPLERARLEDPNGRFSTDEVNRLWEQAVAASGDAALGLDAELAARHIDFEGVGFVMLSSADLRAGLEEFARYLALISSATTFEVVPDPAGAWIAMGHTGNTRPVPPQRSAYSLLALLAMCRWIARQPIRPLRVQFGFAQPPEPQAYARAFGCEVDFGQTGHRMLLAAADLAAAIPSHNADLLALHERALDERLAALGEDSITRRAAEVVTALLPQGEPRRQQVAERLALTDRAFQRRLQAEHTSFQQVLDETRRALAARHLRDRRLALGQVAHRLGFSDESNFFRACRRWFGMAPGQYREEQAAAGGS